MEKINYDKVDYDIRCSSPEDFEMTITMYSKKDAFSGLLVAGMKKVNKLKKISETAQKKVMNAIDEFDALPEHLPYLNSVMSKQISKVENELKENNVFLITKKVIGCRYRKFETHWEIIAHIKGKYVQR